MYTMALYIFMFVYFESSFSLLLVGYKEKQMLRTATPSHFLMAGGQKPPIVTTFDRATTFCLLTMRIDDNSSFCLRTSLRQCIKCFFIVENRILELWGLNSICVPYRCY